MWTIVKLGAGTPFKFPTCARAPNTLAICCCLLRIVSRKTAVQKQEETSSRLMVHSPGGEGLVQSQKPGAGSPTSVAEAQGVDCIPLLSAGSSIRNAAVGTQTSSHMDASTTGAMSTCYTRMPAVLLFTVL